MDIPKRTRVVISYLEMYGRTSGPFAGAIIDGGSGVLNQKE